MRAGETSASTCPLFDSLFASWRPWSLGVLAFIPPGLRRLRLELDRLAGLRGFVDGLHDRHVAEALLAGGLGRLVLDDALGEGVHLGGELVGVAHVGLVDLSAATALAELDAAVAEGGFDLGPAAGADRAEAVQSAGVARRAA